MKVKTLFVVALVSAIAMVTGCMSLDERLASPDEKVRIEAQNELWVQAQTGQQKLAAVARLTDSALLVKIAQTCEDPVGTVAVAKIAPVDCLQLAVGAMDSAVRRSAFEKLEETSAIVSFYGRSRDDALKSIAIKKLVERKCVQELEKLYTSESSQKWRRLILEQSNDDNLYLLAYRTKNKKDVEVGKWIIGKISPSGLAQIPYSTDLMLRWRDIGDSTVLAKLLRDAGNDLSEDVRKEFVSKIVDVKVIKEMCTPPSAEILRKHELALKEAEEMRVKAKEKKEEAVMKVKKVHREYEHKKKEGKKRTIGVGGYQAMEKAAKAKKEAAELNAKAEEASELPWLYVGDDKVLWVACNISNDPIRNDILTNMLIGNNVLKLANQDDVVDVSRSDSIRAKDLKPDVALKLVAGVSDQVALCGLATKAHQPSIRIAAISLVSDIVALRKIRLSSTDDVTKTAVTQRLKALGASDVEELVAFEQYDRTAFWILYNLDSKDDIGKVAQTAKLKGIRLAAACRLEPSLFSAIATKESKMVASTCPAGHFNLGGLYLGMDIADAFAVLAAKFPEVKPTIEWSEDEKALCAYENVHDNSSRYRILVAADDLAVKCINVLPSMTKKMIGFDAGTFDELRNSVEKHFKFPLHSELFQTTDYNQIVGVVTTTDEETLHYFESEKERDKKYMKKIASLLGEGPDVEFVPGERGGLRLQYTRNAAKGKPIQNGTAYNGGNRGDVDASGRGAGSLMDVARSGINMMRNNAESLKASANALDALSKGDIGGALQSGAEAMKKNVETLKDASKVLSSSGALLEGATK